ncbi:hypothetical protein SAMN05216556_10826 [Aequorivita viscosa]|uniref:Uncharacterized protein n=1 Tax=Aequorivita viscosa TaxID=797419 RepID=A0A1M6F274_9FLAO|nr:hypothetical protein SAMN05216556_10826 [Aequorivita viscosa]SHI91818.1 hypothetical protein SAMN04487908_10725 [Aequorivita viscosa]
MFLLAILDVKLSASTARWINRGQTLHSRNEIMFNIIVVPKHEALVINIYIFVSKN